MYKEEVQNMRDFLTNGAQTYRRFAEHAQERAISETNQLALMDHISHAAFNEGRAAAFEEIQDNLFEIIGGKLNGSKDI